MEAEKILTLNLRKEWKKTKIWKRSKKAVSAIKKYIAKNFKIEENNVKIDPWLNMEIWKGNLKNPPSHIRVKARKEKDFVYVEPFETPKKKLKREKRKLMKLAKQEGKLEKVKKEEEKKEKKKEEEPESKEEEKKKEGGTKEKKNEEKKKGEREGEKREEIEEKH